MDIGIMILVVGLIFLGKYTGAGLLTIGGAIILLSQIFVVESTIVIIGIIFVVIYLAYDTLHK